MPLLVKWPYPPNINDFPLMWKVASRLTMASVGFTSKIFTNFFNDLRTHNIETLYNAIENRPKGTPMITVCNHHSCLDEPLIWGMLKWRHLTYRNDLMRWTTGASDVVFTKEWHSTFFALGQTVPLVRGDGVYQRSVDFCIELLNNGSWVHIFPEGKVNGRKNPLRLKWGIGRLISECKVTPIVIPFWQLGMDDVLPNTRPYRLNMFKKITTLVGDPMNLEDTMQRFQKDNVDQITRLKILTNMVQKEFQDLEFRAKQLHSKGDS